MVEQFGVAVPLTNLLQKKDNDLLHAVTKTRIVIKLCNDKWVDQNVWNGLYDKAVDVSSNFAIHPTMSRRAGREKNRANTDVQTVSDFYRVTVYYVFRDHLVKEMETRILGNEDRYCAQHLMQSLQDERLSMPLPMIFLKHIWCSRQT